jgi:hypothetical protein
MVDTTDAVRRDIEMTRARMSTTLAQLEDKVNVVQRIRDHPWPALGVAFGAGVALGVSSGPRARTAVAVPRGVARGAGGGRLSGILEEVIAHLLRGLREVAESQIDNVLADLKLAMRDSGASAPDHPPR